jgi:diguanylate cyclase (GGDEF)-like protein/PAS domain S-box-containing protein
LPTGLDTQRKDISLSHVDGEDLGPDGDPASHPELYEAIVENLADAVLINVGDKRVFVNQAYLRLHGLTDKAEALGLPVEHFIVPEDRQVVTSRTLARQEGEAILPTYEYRIRRSDGEIRTVETSVATITYQGRSAALAVLRDVTKRHELEEELASLARSDPLTDTLNRRSFLQELNRRLAEHEKMALLFLDVDGLKRLNDRFGHRVGDDYLIHLVAAIRQDLRGSDVLGRVGGDEFAIILSKTNVEQAKVIARRMLEAARSVGGQDLGRGTIAVGIACAPEHATSGEDLMHCADLAMYIAKFHGGDRAQLYDPSVDKAA